jgi:hypothetical protein
VPPVGKKSSPYSYPSGRVPNRYQIPVPELPSLVQALVENLGFDVVSVTTDGSGLSPLACAVSWNSSCSEIFY